MAKTVKIPDRMNPFRVIINGVEYSYPGGTEQEVPDDVAAAIEHHQKIHEELSTPKSFTGGGALAVETDKSRSVVTTPLKAIRDAWLAGRPVILPVMQAGYTNVFTLATGGVRSDNGEFLSAQFIRVSDIGVEMYTVEGNGRLTYKLLQ